MKKNDLENMQNTFLLKDKLEHFLLKELLINPSPKTEARVKFKNTVLGDVVAQVEARVNGEAVAGFTISFWEKNQNG